MKTTLFSLLFSITSLSLLAQVSPEWMRYPSVSPDGRTIAFVYQGDIYTVLLEGGQAERLTFQLEMDAQPVWSPDGQSIAFASERHGNFDVYVMDAKGGEATRLSYHSNNEIPLSFSADGQMIYFDAHRLDNLVNREYPTSSHTELYSVPVQGGGISQVFSLPVKALSERDNRGFLYEDMPGREDAWRKHHQSAVTHDIWQYNRSESSHTKLTDFIGEDRNPVWNGDGTAFYFLSERSGTFNVHKQNLASRQVEQLTYFETHPVRFLSAATTANGDEILVFGYHGELFTMQLGQQPSMVPVTIRTQQVTSGQERIMINGGVSEMAISPNGKEMAFIARGEVFVTSLDGSLTKRLTSTSENERFVEFSPDGKSVVYASERNGKWSIFQTKVVRAEEPFFYAATLLQEEALISNEKDNYLPQFSPDGSQIAFVEDRRTIKVRNIDSGDEVVLLDETQLFHMRDGDKYFSWSPDSKWLLVEFDQLLNNADVYLLDASAKQDPKALVNSGYYDRMPKWVQNGKQMIWMSNRNGLKSYATSGSTEYDVYSMFFTQKGWDEFNLSEEQYKLKKAIEEAQSEQEIDEESSVEKEAKKILERRNSKAKNVVKGEAQVIQQRKDKEVEELQFDWDNLVDRVAKLTIHSSRMSDAVLSKDGSTLYYLTRFDGGYDLWSTKLRSRETKVAISLDGSSGELMWDKEQEQLFLLSGGRITKLDPEKGTKTTVSIASETSIDAHQERLAMFDHIALRTSKIFYEPTFHGVDWPMMVQEYRTKVDDLGHDYEFAELISELVGELNVSHAGGRYRGVSGGDETASLGIFMDYTHQGDGIKISELVQGGPLDKASLEIEVGDIIQKIDGEPVTADKDWALYLNHKAGKMVLLTVTNDSGKNEREFTVLPITQGAFNGLLYNRFVEINEQEVLDRSNGRLGYVHISGMGDRQFRDVIDRMLGKHYDKEAIVVDARNNGGGDLVADLQMFFTGTRFLTYATEQMVVGGEPTSRWTKPIIGLFNEDMYSDGHCYASAFSDLNLGTMVGTPVPGTCSFAGWEGLPNGSVWGVVPVSAKNKAGEWLENNQTMPDLFVQNEPAVMSSGRDEQLEAAIEQMLKELEQ